MTRTNFKFRSQSVAVALAQYVATANFVGKYSGPSDSAKFGYEWAFNSDVTCNLGCNKTFSQDNRQPEWRISPLRKELTEAGQKVNSSQKLLKKSVHAQAAPMRPPPHGSPLEKFMTAWGYFMVSLFRLHLPSYPAQRVQEVYAQRCKGSPCVLRSYAACSQTEPQACSNDWFLTD